MKELKDDRGVVRVALRCCEWNPVKELKVYFISFLKLTVLLWNPVKELKAGQSCPEASAALPQWNPVKELKDHYLGYAVCSDVPNVESGEGIERNRQLRAS